MGEAVVDLSSPKETARIGTATTARSSASVILIDDGTLDTIFCPIDGLSIASTLDDVFCSVPMDDSVVDSPNQRRRKQIAEVFKQNDRHSPEKKEKNRVASPRTPRGHPRRDLSKHRKSEIKSSPHYPSASESRKEDEEANLYHKRNEAENLVNRRTMPPRTASKSRIENDGIHVEGTKRTSKRRNSNSQVEGVKQQPSHSAGRVDNSKRTRSSSNKSAITNLEKRIERSISSHRRGNSEPRIRDPKQQKETVDINSGDRASRTVSLERTIDRSKSSHTRRTHTLLHEKSNQGSKSETPITTRRSQLAPQRSISTSRIESLDRQIRRSLNKRSSSDSRILQDDHDRGTDEIKQSVRSRASPLRNGSKSRIENLEIQIERSRSSHRRRSSNSRRGTETSNREPRSLQRAGSKTKIDRLEKQGEQSRVSHRRGNSKSGTKDINTKKKNDGSEKSERTRSSQQTHSSHRRPSSKTRIQSPRKVESKEKVRHSEHRNNAQDERGKLDLAKGKHRRRNSKSRIGLPIDAEHPDSSERTRSSHNRGGSVSTSQQSGQHESKLASISGSDTQRTLNISHPRKLASSTFDNTESAPQLEPLPVPFGYDTESPKTEPTDGRGTEKGYLIRPFWRKGSGAVDGSSAGVRSPSPRLDRRFGPDMSMRNTSRNIQHSLQNNDPGQKLVGKSPTKRMLSRHMLQSNFQPQTGNAYFTDITPLRTPEDGVMSFREHFPTALTASEAAITTRKEEKVALLQSTKVVENRSPRERIKSLSPTKFFKKASQRFSNAVAQLSERVLPLGASDVPSRERPEPMSAQKTKASIREAASQYSAVRPDNSNGDPRPSLRPDAKTDASERNSYKDIERSPRATDQKNSRPRPRSKSVSGLESKKIRTISPTRNLQRQNSRHASAHKIRGSSLRHLGSPSSPGNLSGTVSPHGFLIQQNSRIELGSQNTSVATPSTKYSSDSSTRPVAPSPRHRRLASSLAARHSLGVSPIADTEHVH